MIFLYMQPTHAVRFYAEETPKVAMTVNDFDPGIKSQLGLCDSFESAAVARAYFASQRRAIEAFETLLNNLEKD